MQIRQQQLKQHLSQQIVPLYVLNGQELFLAMESIDAIKSALHSRYSCDEIKLNIQTSSDWQELLEQSQNLSLFHDYLLIFAYYDKKTLDAEGKKALTRYLEAQPSSTCLILHTPQLPNKALQWLQNDKNAGIVTSYPLDAAAMKQWIHARLKSCNFSFQADIPDLIYHFTKGTMFASAQCIEKLSLVCEPNTTVTLEMVRDQLIDQSEFTLYELMDAMLQGQSKQAVHIIKKLSQDKTEPTLVLWMLAQELRLTIQLKTQGESASLKIWPQRMRYFTACCRRISLSNLHELLQYCLHIDEQIKSSHSGHVWLSIENLVLSVATGRLLGDACKL